MKNSEWGAVAYLGQSEYGSQGSKICINNITLESGNRKRTDNIEGATGVDSVYAVTGVTTGSTSAGRLASTIENINSTSGNNATSGVYTWNQGTGQEASTTLNMYGIFDISGGGWERTAGMISNGSANLTGFASSLLTKNGKSTKYVTIYPHNSEQDAIRETSINGSESNSWNSEFSIFPALNAVFITRGGNLWCNSHTGEFSYSRSYGDGSYDTGFRTVPTAN